MNIDEQDNQFETLAHGENERPKATKENKRICDFCGKAFRGGKALGGHRRSHLHPPKKLGLSKKHVLNLSHDLGVVRSIKIMFGKRTCCICNKDFPSMKSLSGHMRSHPDRDWRGIQPPLQSNTNNATTSSTNSSVTDLLKFVSNWSKTDKRGRKSIGGAAAAHSLICLSLGENSLRVQEKDIVVHSESKNNKDSYRISRKKKKVKNWEKMLRHSERGEVDGLFDGYKCSNCGKIFQTFQALGGHRSSHNKDKKRQTTTNDEIDMAVENDGHIRCDWTGVVDAPKIASSHGEVSQTCQRILDFDLNQPYLMENDEGIGF
ncbi:zinc finger protein ZAT9-like [Fagus crenata]